MRNVSTRWMISARQRRQVLFWAAIGLILMPGAQQIVADPTYYTGYSRSPVIISEFLASYSDEADDSNPNARSFGAGWIELYNRSSRVVDLAEWTLTDDPYDPNKWTFPPLLLEGGDHLIVWAEGATIKLSNESDDESDDVLDKNELFFQTNVKLNLNGGFLALYPPTTRRFMDGTSIQYPPQRTNISYGKANFTSSGGGYSYLTNVTPDQSNDGGVRWRGQISPIVVSDKRGFFYEPFRLSLSSTTPEVTIRYTLDGSTPSLEHGFEYERDILIESTTLLRAIAVKEEWLPSSVTTHTYLFPADVVNQPKNPTAVSNAAWPDTWGTHRITLFGYNKGDPVIADYEMDPSITQDPEYGPHMIESLLSLPSISLVTDSSNLDIYFDDPQMRGPQSERPSSVEFLYPDGKRENVQSGAGLRIQGGAGRWEYMPKHSFRLFFKQKYGASRLNHKVFDDSPLTSFNTLILRGGVGRSFAGHPNTVDKPFENNEHHWTTYTRDEWARDSQIALSGVGSHGAFFHLYLNGLYWGLYNAVERPDRVFAADYYGSDVADWFTANHGGAGDGQPDRFVVMLQLAEAGGLADPAKYATMLEFVDPIQFSDYLILNWVMGNRDWPENNWYTNVRYPAGRNLFFVWDAENSWNQGAELRLGAEPKEGAPFPNVTKVIFDALMENPEYRLLLADRFSTHLRNDGLLTDAASQTRWQAITDPLESAIIAESARWGDTRYEAPITQADWRVASQDVLAQMEGNAERLLQQARDVGYYPLVDPPRFSQHGGSFDEPLTVQIEADGAHTGDFYITLDGSDPRDPSAQIYAEPIQLAQPKMLKARQVTNGVWSALTEARFSRSDQPGAIQITEIMYNPPDGSIHGENNRASELYEFLEIRNVGGDELDLSLAYFEGITFVFPMYTTLQAGGKMVLIRDFRAFRQRYETADFHGIYKGKLSDRGERISLRERTGTLLASVTYDNENGWPLSADGSGDSLVRTDPNGSANNPLTWRASSQLYGSPGE